MTNKEHVLRYGGELSINGDEVQTMPNGHDVHLTLGPKVGCHGANIAVGFHKPGREFTPHKHPISEEALIIRSGKSECYPYDKWISVETGDIMFALPGVLHGTRNPAENTKDLVTLSITIPPQLDLYLRAGYDVLEDNSGEYTEEV